MSLTAHAAKEIRVKANGALTKRSYKLFCQVRDVRARWVGTDDEWVRLHTAALAVREELEKQGVHVAAMSEKTRQRLATFESSTAIKKLVSLPKELIERAEARRKAGQPVRYGDAVDVAVAIALLLEFTKPLRLSNLVELERNWLRLPDRRDEPGSLAIPGHRVKTGEPLFATLPPHKVKAIKLFIIHYRPLLTDQPGCRWLFPSQAGDAHKQAGRMGRLIVDRVYALTGLVLNVHLLRGITAALLYRRTRSLDDVRSLLGHSKNSQSYQFYLYLQQQMASVVLDEAIEAELGEITSTKHKR
jgi:integrase